MFERFTNQSRRVVVLAQEEARRLNHNYIGTEHLLLGLLHEGRGSAARVLTAMDITLGAARDQVVAIIGQGQAQPSGHIPFTPRAKKSLELSLREALQLGDGLHAGLRVEVDPLGHRVTFRAPAPLLRRVGAASPWRVHATHVTRGV